VPLLAPRSELFAGEKLRPQFQAAGVVHGEYVHGSATDRSDPHDAYTSEQKVLSSVVAPGMKEGRNLAAEWIDTREVRSLAKIATVARQREIVDIIAPAVLFGDDMLDVMG
jgi:hypothetical protein